MATATEIISLAEAKQQIGLPPGVENMEDPEDGRLTAYIEAALIAVERHTGFVMLDKEVEECFTPLTRYSAHTLKTPVPPGTAKTGTLFVSYIDLEQVQQRVECVYREIPISRTGVVRYKIYPPEDSWPETADHSQFGGLYYATVSAGLVAANVPAPLKVAALLMISTMYEGSSLDMVPMDNPAMMLMKNYKVR